MKYEAYHEIHRSYKEMAKTISLIKQYEPEIIEFFKDKQECILLGCGSSYWASMSIARSFIAHTDKKVVALKAAEVVLAPDEYVKGYEHPTLLIPSRSGESKELLEAIHIFQQHYPQASIFAITEFQDNALKDIADFHIALPFVEEISICQTRSFNCLYTAMIDGSTLTYGMTIGMADIMASKKVLLQVSGEGKEKIYQQFLTKQINPQLPASFLWLHPNVEVHVCGDQFKF